MSTGSELQIKGTRIFEKGNYQEAIGIFTEAMEAYRSENNGQMAAEMQVNIGMCKRELEQYEDAIKEMQVSLAYFDEHGPQVRKAQTMGNMALAYAKLGDTEQAQTMYREAGAIFRELNEDEQYGETVLALADMYFRAGDMMLAAATYEVGLDYIKNLNQRQKMMRQLGMLRARLTGEKKAQENASTEATTDSRRRRRGINTRRIGQGKIGEEKSDE
ncbi:MAG: tetratricopeptide repeat protein [Chloroflexi bacterium]|nr:tetratricopeptide repeat protein [Chloroflexota bacterium]